MNLPVFRRKLICCLVVAWMVMGIKVFPGVDHIDFMAGFTMTLLI
jgi:hypothetical protein